MKPPTDPQKTADEFNQAVPVGHWIRYREIRGEGPGKLHRVRSAAFVLSGHTASVHLHGKGGCVCVTHCETVADQEAATREAQLGNGPPPALLDQLAKGGSPHDYHGGEFRRDGNLIYNLRRTGDPRHPFENDVAINVVAHHLPRETQDAIVEEMTRAANRAFCPSVEPPPRTHLIVNVDQCGRGDELVAFWRAHAAGYTTSLANAGTYAMAYALKVERESDRAVAIPLTDLGHRLIPDDDVVPFTGHNRELLVHLLQVAQYRKGNPRA